MRKKTSKIFCFFCFVCFVFLEISASAAAVWSEIKDKHFVVYYESKDDAPLAKEILRRAEGYYQKIGGDIGYLRTNKMWTWDNRVEIFLFATQNSFLANTGQPLWSTGYADRDSRLFKSRTIVTFRQEDGFVDGLLPHEISHLILHDFVGESVHVPVWFDEGIAQMQEKDKRGMVRGMMKPLALRKQHIAFDTFVGWDIRKEKDPRKAQIFYAQSLSVVDYLATEYGMGPLGRLCRALRDKKDFSAALSFAYPGVFASMGDLEKKWILSFNH